MTTELLEEELDDGLQVHDRVRRRTNLAYDEVLSAPIRDNALGIPGRSPLCKHDARSTWVYVGYSEKAEGYHLWRCTVGGCKSTMISACTKRTRVDRECLCFEEVEEWSF